MLQLPTLPLRFDAALHQGASLVACEELVKQALQLGQVIPASLVDDVPAGHETTPELEVLLEFLLQLRLLRQPHTCRLRLGLEVGLAAPLTGAHFPNLHFQVFLRPPGFQDTLHRRHMLPFQARPPHVLNIARARLPALECEPEAQALVPPDRDGDDVALLQYLGEPLANEGLVNDSAVDRHVC